MAKKDDYWNEYNGEGLTQLHVAARNGWRFQLPYLIRMGSDPNKKSYEGLTAYDYALDKGYLASANYLKRVMEKTNGNKSQV